MPDTKPSTNPFEKTTTPEAVKPEPSKVPKLDLKKEVSVNEFLLSVKDLPAFARPVIAKQLKKALAIRSTVEKFQVEYDKIMNKKISGKGTKKEHLPKPDKSKKGGK